MSKQENIHDSVKELFDLVETLEYFADTEIVGEDSRHLVNSVANCKRECIDVLSKSARGELNKQWQMKYLYDRLKQIKSDIKVMQGTLSRSEKAIERAIEISNRIADIVEPEQIDDDE